MINEKLKKEMDLIEKIDENLPWFFSEIMERTDEHNISNIEMIKHLTAYRAKVKDEQRFSFCTDLLKDLMKMEDLFKDVKMQIEKLA